MLQFLSISRKAIYTFLTACAWMTAPLQGFAICPDLSSYYRDLEEDPLSVDRQLSRLLDDCYDNSEYFALLGAAQVDIGDLFRAAENLERSLLLDPQNGSSAFDYAEVLFRRGQVISALEINDQLSERDDLPDGMGQLIAVRSRQWRAYTVDYAGGVGLAYGHDNNLNSAPLGERLTLTLSGRPISLEVSPEFRANGGSYTGVTAGVTRTQEGLGLTSRVSGSLRGRFSGVSQYEMVQASFLIDLAESSEDSRWSTLFGADHLNFGKNAIFSSSTLRASYRVANINNCSFLPTVAAQYQYFHKQPSLSGVESSLGLEMDCFFLQSDLAQRVGMAVSALDNRATRSNRLGSDRSGWRLNLAIQKQVGSGQLLAQYVHTDLGDESGYSSIFSNGAKREESLDSFFVRYLLPAPFFGRSAQFTASLYHNAQRSTIELFRTRGTSAEIGVNWGI